MHTLKQSAKTYASKVGLLRIFHEVRSNIRRDTRRWIREYLPVSSARVSYEGHHSQYILPNATPVFVETGTVLGTMVEFIATTGVECHSIEIDRFLYQRAKRTVGFRANISLSGVELPKLLRGLASPAFWLDGHYSGWSSGRGDLDTPVSKELQAILDHRIKSHVILIDDARCFTGSAGYPRLSHLLGQFEEHPVYRAWVSADIIPIEPRSAA